MSKNEKSKIHEKSTIINIYNKYFVVTKFDLVEFNKFCIFKYDKINKSL